jgi:DNA-binding transcriptional ArsR family regulator
VALGGERPANQLQLRFRLSESYSFGEHLAGWQTSADARWSLPLDSGLLESAGASPVAGLARDPTNDLERHAARAMAWIEDSMIDGDRLRSLLFSFFALEAMLGDSSEGLKGNGLAYRRALLSHATRGSFPDPDQVYLLYDRVRSAAVHGEEPPPVSERDQETFVRDVKDALGEYLDLASRESFETRRRLLRYLREHPERAELDEWLAEFGDRGWSRFLSADQPLEDQEAAEVAKALSHPLRLGFLRALGALGRDGVLSPSEYARESGEALGNVSYHAKVLATAGVLDIGETVPRRGAGERRYSLSGPRATVAMALLRGLAGVSGRVGPADVGATRRLPGASWSAPIRADST